LLGLVEHVCEQTVDGVVLSELFLENEQVVVVVEYSVVVRLKQVRLHLATQLFVCLQIYFLDLCSVQTAKYARLICRISFKYLFDLRKLRQ
jgi:hypothetical protein